jgi:hypothetical protein
MTARPLFDALLYARLGAFLLAFVVAAQAFRGYRRNDSPPMLYLAAAFALFGAEPFVDVLLARWVGAGTDLQYATLAANLVLLGGGFLLVYRSLGLAEGEST